MGVKPPTDFGSVGRAFDIVAGDYKVLASETGCAIWSVRELAAAQN